MYAFVKRLGSFAKKMRYVLQGVLYSYKEKSGMPIKLHFPRKTVICLHPQGQIAKLLYARQFEQLEIKLVINYLKPGMNGLDIGANIGLYSLIADKIISPLGKVWAFEPSTENFDRLVANVSLNNAVTVNAVQIALGDVEDKMVVLRRDSGLGDAERYLELQQGQKYTRNASGNDSGDAEQVRVTTLDSYLYKELKPPPKIDFMKLDVEGGELRVFHGARRTLTENPNIMIFFECFTLWCERAGGTPDEVFQYLRTFGFEIYAMNKNSHQWESNKEIINTAINVWACRHKSMLPRIS